MGQNKNKGFVVSAVLYPLLILFLALIMGLLSMSDTRKRILDKMKLEISDSVFDEATCSCDTILNKLNYLIKNGVGGGGGGGSYTNNVLGLNVTAYETAGDMPNVNNASGDIAVITTTEILNYYVSPTAPTAPKEGTTWIIMDRNENYYILSDYSNIPVSYIVQYEGGAWVPKQSYVYDAKENRWQSLNYIDSSQYTTEFAYTGKYQKYTATYAGTYKIQLWGAEGGSYNATYHGGKGGYTEGEIYLEAGEELYFYVGGATTTTTAGWNGGGIGYGNGRGGGGATDVRLTVTAAETTWNEFNSLKSRIMVAGGGGGGAYYPPGPAAWNGQGGAGGALSGGAATSTSSATGNTNDYLGRGGTQTSAGYANNSTDTKGNFGIGGNYTGGAASYGISGGGGGYYGGGGGNYAGGSSGGGSSFISGYEGCNAIDVELSETTSQIVHTGQSIHSSGKKFINGSMEAGVQSGNGKAAITLTTVGEMSPEKVDEVGASYVYNYTGAYEALHITTSGTYEIETWGASGGTTNGSYPGGKGGYAKGQIYLEKGQTIYIYVGGKGTGQIGGYNGGGYGFAGGGGGGATDIRVNINSGDWDSFDNLKNRIMVAGGGGGGAIYTASPASYSGSGGAGGGSVGKPGTTIGINNSFGAYVGTGGEQTKAGMAGGSTATSGSFGKGGNYSYSGSSYGPAGGGSGWYGGGGGSFAGGPAGGGSSYISGHNGCNAVRENSTSDNIIHLGVSESYTGYVFTNTKMETGVNSGDGKAQVKLIDTARPVQKYEVKDVYTFEYDGAYIPFIIPRTGNYQVELWGASGTGLSSYVGGKGGYTAGKINLLKGTIIYVYVGGQAVGFEPGANGGGYIDSGYGRGGGGATDIRLIAGTGNDTASYASRIMVAGAGGSAGYYPTSPGAWSANGGAGGGLIGYQGIQVGSSSTSGYLGTGGTQISAGLATGSAATKGSFGKGGNSSAGNNTYGSGGGGSGWYGGGGSYYAGGGGGGGSSYISGHAGCIGVSNLAVPNATTYTTLSDSYSYTGYKFSDTVMIDGRGYNWTTEKGEYVGMPQYDGVQVMEGNTGNGFAKITWLGTS